ncbi:spore cortex biosynthesis protein YabQ [Candidatus Gracilibacteria bacterium]|nr:spore cortex biosynthesis protein YabQ [Candidatus Gracilibacteria bacterium]
MNRFQTLFFSSYIAPEESIQHIFHRHFFVIIEDIILWIFFALFIPGFLYYLNFAHIQDILTLWHIYAYLFTIYFILIYKIFDWYTDVWILTGETLIDLRWQFFTSNLVIIPFEKIEGMEVRTYSWIYSVLGISDIVVKLLGNESLILRNASEPTDVIHALQEAVKPHKKGYDDADKEPFDILVDTLSDVVKGHLVTGGKQYITRDYIEKLDETLHSGKPIDLRTQTEKIVIENWKSKYEKKESDEHEEGHDNNH